MQYVLLRRGGYKIRLYDLRDKNGMPSLHPMLGPEKAVHNEPHDGLPMPPDKQGGDKIRGLKMKELH